MDDSKLKVGITVYGTVVGHYQGRASVSIRGCKFRASLDKDDTDFTDEEKMSYVEKLLPIGSAVKAKVVKYEKEPKIKILLSTEKKVFEKYSNEDEIEEEEKEQNHLDLLIKSVEEINAAAALQEENTTEIKITKNYALPQEAKPKKDDDEEENMEEEENNEEDGASDDDKSDLDEDEVQKLIANQGVEFEGFDSNEEDGEGNDDDEDDDESIMSEQSLLDEEFGDEDVITNKKKSKRQKDILKRRKEEEIREQEKKLVDGTA